MNEHINYYDLLGVKKDASIDDIKKAYRIQAKKWHPDINKDENAPEIIKKLNEAKTILLDSTKRKEYDEYLDNLSNPKYDKLKEKQSNYNTNQNNYNNTYTNESYTKWEYLKMYIKHYKINPFIKILSCIFVLIESVICTTLQIINYLLAFSLAYIGGLLSYIIGGLSGLYLIVIILSSIFSLESAPNGIIEWSESILIVILGLFLSVIIIFIPEILISVLPNLISKLDIFLFKLSVGYKKN